LPFCGFSFTGKEEEKAETFPGEGADMLRVNAFAARLIIEEADPDVANPKVFCEMEEEEPPATKVGEEAVAGREEDREEGELAGSEEKVVRGGVRALPGTEVTRTGIGATALGSEDGRAFESLCESG
jgi:hypothetical protein